MQIEVGTQVKTTDDKGVVTYHPPGKVIDADKRFAEKTKRYKLRLSQVDENEKKSLQTAAARIVDPEKQAELLDSANKKESRKRGSSKKA